MMMSLRWMQKDLEIPPPRPKRKPLHPYPRKSGAAPALSVLRELGRCSPNMERDSGQGGRSPLMSVLANIRNICAADSRGNEWRGSAVPAPIARQASGSGLKYPADQKEKKPMLAKEKPDMEMGTCSMAKDLMANTKTIKLFGKTVVVNTTTSGKSSSCAVRSMEQLEDAAKHDHRHKKARISPSPGTSYPVVPSETSRNHLPTFLYNFSSQKINMAGGPAEPPPQPLCWAPYGCIPAILPSFLPPLGFGNPCRAGDEPLREEGSQTASNEMSQRKWFMPYKQSMVEREVEQSTVGGKGLMPYKQSMVASSPASHHHHPPPFQSHLLRFLGFPRPETMLVYKDLLTGDLLLSNTFNYKEIENGILWEVEGKCIVMGALDVNMGANPNPSGEGGEEDESVDDQAVMVVDIVHTFRLQKQPAFDSKQFVIYMKKFILLLTPKLDREKEELFRKNIEGAMTYLLSKLKDFQFFVGESMHDNSTLVFAYYKDGATDPTFLYFAYALKEIKCGGGWV